MFCLAFLVFFTVIVVALAALKNSPFVTVGKPTELSR